jgi:polyhydroxybutyrate depolymerase
MIFSIFDYMIQASKAIKMQMRNVRRLVLNSMLIGLLSVCNFTAFAANQQSAASGQRQNLTHDGIERSYVVRVPHHLVQRNGLVPLVLVLHGGGGNADNAERMTGFTEEAEKEGFIVVYPDGTGRFSGKLLTWNAGHCCGYAKKNRVDDVGFINALIDRLIKDYPADPKRIYATGMSNGGMMTHRLGIELSNRFAAIAPVVAALFGDETRPQYPVSALMLNGMLDKHVPVQGGLSGGRFPDSWDGTPMKPVQEQAAFWALADGCTHTPVKEENKAFILTRYQCPDGRGVGIYLVKDNGHAWPGGKRGSRMGDKPSTALNATGVIWSFFKSNTK